MRVQEASIIAVVPEARLAFSPRVSANLRIDRNIQARTRQR